jgi:hypothetical protein
MNDTPSSGPPPEPPPERPSDPSPELSSGPSDPPSASSNRRIIEARHDGHVWTTEQLDQLELRDGQPSLRRSFTSKMFDISRWGWVKLGLLCLVVGVVLRAAEINPFDRSFAWSGALASLAGALGRLGLWLLANGWAPALIGVCVVMPLWLLWRLLSVPFRR